jgi:hypothetical protein
VALADYYLATFLSQPSWVRDIRPFRAVMMPLEPRPAAPRHRALHSARGERARTGCATRAAATRST